MNIKLSNTSKTLIYSVVAFVIFVILAVASGAWPDTNFAAQILAAFAGAIVAAIITLLLLNSQTESEVMKERDSKVFEQKLQIYKEFYAVLCNVIRDRKITKEEEIDLQFQVANIAMHTDHEHIEQISENVYTIILQIKKGETSNNFLRNLFEIDHSFREELYGKQEYGDKELNAERQAVDLFSSITLGTRPEDTILYERLMSIKNLIKSNGARKWIWENRVLVNEFFTERNKNNNFVKGNELVLDLLQMNNDLVLSLYRRNATANEVKDIVKDTLSTEFHPMPGEPCRHIAQTFSLQTDDKDIAIAITTILKKLAEYRNNHF